MSSPTLTCPFRVVKAVTTPGSTASMNSSSSVCCLAANLMDFDFLIHHGLDDLFPASECLAEAHSSNRDGFCHSIFFHQIPVHSGSVTSSPLDIFFSIASP